MATTLTNETPVNVTGDDNIAQVELDSRYSLIVFRDQSDSNNNKAYVLDTSDMSEGSPVTFETSSSGQFSIDKVSAILAIVSWVSGSDLKVCMLSISGKVITAGTPSIYESGYTSPVMNNVAVISATEAVVVGRDSIAPHSTDARRIVFSGTIISSVGAAQNIFTGTTNFMEVVPAVFLQKLTSTTLAFIYRDATPSPDEVKVLVLSVSGDTITAGTAAVVYAVASNPDSFSVSVVSATKIFTVITNAANQYYGTISTISGTTITPGTPTILDSVGAGYADIFTLRALDETYALYYYTDTGSDQDLYAELVNVSGNVPNIESSLNISLSPSSTNTPMTMAILSSTKIVGLWIPTGTETAAIILVSSGCRFYFGLLAGALQEKFTLPFSGVAPKGMTLDKSLGTVVMVADSANSDPVVYSTNPYITGTVTDENFPENAAGVVAKWI